MDAFNDLNYGALYPLAVAAGAVAIGLWGAFHCACRAIAAYRSGDQRTRNDQAAAQRQLRVDPPAIDTQPGRDNDLLLDAALAYYGPAHNTRKED
ncbi:hypothetical protein [Streptomyces bullii]|uniref:Uncharacterized protein n=1 Tax=Streptomyces bullii TaxID=349910 RepID=A0ABW0URZ0_9ACTN